jgi:hypothetical protein
MTEGKMHRGWRLTCQSWSVVRLRPMLLAIPALSAVMTIAAAALLLGPWSLDAIGHHSRERMFVDAAICAYPLIFIATYFNVAFYAMAAAAFDGYPMSIGAAFGRARSRVSAIALWTLTATLVGIAVRGLEQLPAGGLAARVAEWLGSLAWSLATFFVVPVLALEDVGVRGALRRSVGTIRATWGESITGTIVVGGSFGLVALVFGAVTALGVVAGLQGTAAGYAVAAAGVVALFVTAVVETAVAQVFRLAVYRYASGSGGTGPFADADLESAFRPRPRRFWR